MTDDELLDRLAQTLAPERIEPPLAGVFALRRAVAAPPRRLAWRPRKIAVAAAAVALGLSGSTAAFAATGAPLPRPLRVVAHGAGLPVDSVSVADTRSATARLKDALAQDNPARVNRAADQLRGRLAQLEPDEKSQIEQPASVLLQEANESGGQDNGPQQDQPSPTRPPSTPARPPGRENGRPTDRSTPGQQDGPRSGNDPSNSSSNNGKPDGADQSAPGPGTATRTAPSPANVAHLPPTTRPTLPPGDTGGGNQTVASNDTGTG